MQDNRPQDIDRQFEDLGWDRMRELLDRDMPVAAAPWLVRPKLLGLLLVLFLLISAGTLTWWKLSQHTPPPSKEPIIAFPATSAPVAATPDKETAPEYESQILPANNTPANDQSLPVADSTLTKNVPSQHARPENAAAVPPLPATSNEEPAIGRAPDEPAAAIAEALLAAIDPIEAGLLEHPQAEPSLPPVRSGRKRLHLSIEGMAIAPSGLTPGGAGLGLHAHRQLGTSRWALGMGLSLVMVNQDLALSKGSTLEEDFRQAAAGGTGSSAVVVPGAIDTRFHYLSMPLQLQYTPGRRFRLEGGLRVSYLLSASENRLGSMDELLADQENSSPGTAAPAFNLDNFAPETVRLLSSATGNGISNANMTNFDLGLNAGITYLPAAHLGINLRYSFGLIDVVKSPDYQRYNRWVQLGLRYYIR